MDRNGDGFIDFNEFVAATVHIHQLEDADSDKFQERVKAAFVKFDTNKDGFIDKEELRVVRATGEAPVLPLVCPLPGFEQLLPLCSAGFRPRKLRAALTR